MGIEIFSNKKAIERATAAASKMNYLSASGVEASRAQTERDIKGEQAATNVFNALGQEGTFEPGSGTGSYGTGQTGMYETDNMPSDDLRKLGGGKATRDLIGTARTGIIDPEGYANAAIGSIPFKIRSKQTAEAFQLLNKEGAEWDMLENSTLGAIHEGAALQLRDTMRLLRNNHAKGGTARRTAIAEFGEIQAAEMAMQARVQETWRANLELHSYIRQNADRVQAGNISYVQSLPGLNASYRSAMQANTAMMVAANEKAAIIAGESYEIRASQVARNVGGKLLEGVIMAAASSVFDKGSTAVGDFLTAQGSGVDDDGNRNPDTMWGSTSTFLGGVVHQTGKNISGAGGLQSLYTPEQQDAVDEAQGRDLQKEALDKLSPGKAPSGLINPGTA